MEVDSKTPTYVRTYVRTYLSVATSASSLGCQLSHEVASPTATSTGDFTHIRTYIFAFNHGLQRAQRRCMEHRYQCSNKGCQPYCNCYGRSGRFNEGCQPDRKSQSLCRWRRCWGCQPTRWKSSPIRTGTPQWEFKLPRGDKPSQLEQRAFCLRHLNLQPRMRTAIEHRRRNSGWGKTNGSTSSTTSRPTTRTIRQTDGPTVAVDEDDARQRH